MTQTTNQIFIWMINGSMDIWIFFCILVIWINGICILIINGYGDVLRF